MYFYNAEPKFLSIPADEVEFMKRFTQISSFPFAHPW